MQPKSDLWDICILRLWIWCYICCRSRSGERRVVRDMGEEVVCCAGIPEVGYRLEVAKLGLPFWDFSYNVDESNCISFLVKPVFCACVDSLCSLEMMRRTSVMRRTRKMCQILKIQWHNIWKRLNHTVCDSRWHSSEHMSWFNNYSRSHLECRSPLSNFYHYIVH